MKSEITAACALSLWYCKAACELLEYCGMFIVFLTSSVDCALLIVIGIKPLNPNLAKTGWFCHMWIMACIPCSTMGWVAYAYTVMD
jgi:hypothetical protein